MPRRETHFYGNIKSCVCLYSVILTSAHVYWDIFPGKLPIKQNDLNYIENRENGHKSSSGPRAKLYHDLLFFFITACNSNFTRMEAMGGERFIWQ